MSDERPLTARELFARGIEQNQFDRPFAGGESPEERRAAADAEANCRRNQEGAELGYMALYERGLQASKKPAAARPATPATPPSPATTGPVDPFSPEAVAAREAAMDRLLAKTWPGGQH